MAADDIGTRIKKRRQALGIRTQQELADAIGVSRDTVSNWESGKHVPIRYLGALEQVLGITLDGTAPDRPLRLTDATLRALRRAIPDDTEFDGVVGYLEGRYVLTEPAAEADVP